VGSNIYEGENLMAKWDTEYWSDKEETMSEEMTTALERQVGGFHYKDMVIQPIEFILANELSFCEGNIVKYICRYKQKGGIEDIKKVIHYAEILLEEMESRQ
jgi:hypothetical protein